MFSVDSLVTDLIFNGGAALERQALQARWKVAGKAGRARALQKKAV